MQVARPPVSRPVPAWVREYVGLEAEAVEIKAFQIDLIPGLLQTEEYTRAITKAADPTRNPDEVERLVAIRRERQARLESDDPPQFWVVIDESVLRRKVGGPEVMHAQLGYLLDVMKLPRVSIQAIPFDSGAHAAVGTAFTIFRLPEPPGGEVTVLEGLWSADYVDKDDQVRAYTLRSSTGCLGSRSTSEAQLISSRTVWVIHSERPDLAEVDLQQRQRWRVRRGG
jgi:Domain of unknown function (DUF5753)